MAVLLVYKENPQDPFLQALKRWIIPLSSKASYFRFRHAERGRFESNEINVRLRRKIDNPNITVIMDWNGLINKEELLLIKSKGIIYFRYINGFTSLHCGHIADQTEFFDHLRLVDFFMVGERTHVSILRDYGINAIHCNWFADPTIYKPIKNFFRRDIYDFFFVGTVNSHWSRNRQAFLEILSKKFKTVIIAGPDANIDNAHCLPQITYEPIVNLLQNQSKIVCGSDYLPSVIPYNNQIKNALIEYDLDYTIRGRTFTSLASARAYLVESHEEIELLFEKGKEILTWKSFDELLSIADRAIGDKEYLESIGNAGYNAVISQHTVFHRLQLVEQLSGQLLFPDLKRYISWTNSKHR